MHAGAVQLGLVNEVLDIAITCRPSPLRLNSSLRAPRGALIEVELHSCFSTLLQKHHIFYQHGGLRTADWASAAESAGRVEGRVERSVQRVVLRQPVRPL